MMITILQVSGLRFIIFANDHEPAHVHVFGDGEAKINLLGPQGQPVLVWVDGMKRSDVRRAMRAAHEWRDMLMARWNQIHGRTD